VTNRQLEVTIPDHPVGDNGQIPDRERRLRIPGPKGVQPVQLADKLLIHFLQTDFRVHAKGRHRWLIAAPLSHHRGEPVPEFR